MLSSNYSNTAPREKLEASVERASGAVGDGKVVKAASATLFLQASNAFSASDVHGIFLLSFFGVLEECIKRNL